MEGKKLIQDALGSPVPQYFNLDLQLYAVQTLDGSVVTNVDFNRTKLIRDVLGSPIPQIWDRTNNKWVAVTSNCMGGEGGTGIQGPKGDTGPQGIQGVDGKDAAVIDNEVATTTTTFAHPVTLSRRVPSRTDDLYNDWFALAKQYLGTVAGGVALQIEVLTLRYTDTNIRQYVTLSINTGSIRPLKILEIERLYGTFSSTLQWMNVAATFSTQHGTGSPEGVVYAYNGMQYIDTLTGDFYFKKFPTTSVSNAGWIKIGGLAS